VQRPHIASDQRSTTLHFSVVGGLVLFSAFILTSCPRPRVPLVAYEAQQEALQHKEAYERYALHPSGLVPPGILMTPLRAEATRVWGEATPLRPEDQTWNLWPDGGARLFNNRMAHVFRVTLQGEGVIGWIPEETTLELNDPSIRLVASGSPDGLLLDLLYFAKAQEDWILDGDLVARTRAAGPFRAAYLPARGDGVLEGIIGFPMSDNGDPLGVAETHVVAERLTVAVTTAEGIERLVWVFE